MRPVVRTALITAAVRARESVRPDALFNDTYAMHLAGEDGVELLDNLERSIPAASGLIPAIIRTYFIDVQLNDIYTNYGFSQVVMLGCGMDARAFRKDYFALQPSQEELSHITFYELDHPELIRLKQARLLGNNAKSLFNRVEISCDLSCDNLYTLLIDNGFNPELPTVWIAEGILIYLDESSIHTLLETITKLSAKESFFLCDLVSMALISNKATEQLRNHLAAEGCPMTYGTDNPQALFSQYGWGASVYNLIDVMRLTGRFSDLPVNLNTTTPGEAYLVSAICK